MTQARRPWYTLPDKKKHREKATGLTVHRLEKESMEACKLLGVHLDIELRLKYLSKETAVKGLKTALALKRLRGL